MENIFLGCFIGPRIIIEVFKKLEEVYLTQFTETSSGIARLAAPTGVVKRVTFKCSKNSGYM